MTDDPFMTAEDAEQNVLPPVFDAQYAGECSDCGEFFAAGDPIRADGLGGWECAEHAG